MKTPPFSVPNLPAPSEYALILGAGAGAAVSIATQQVAAASLPLTTLVAIGLINRHRLDQRLKESLPTGPAPEQGRPSQPALAPRRVSSQPVLDSRSRQPRPVSGAPAPVTSRFSGSRPVGPTPEDQLRQHQQACLKKIGSHLQQVRQDQALSLEAVHQQTFIQVYSLKAIEDGNLKQLPEAFYIRAFIQKYAQSLGLAGADVAAEFPVG